jgi:hypothetical protein
MKRIEKITLHHWAANMTSFYKQTQIWFDENNLVGQKRAHRPESRILNNATNPGQNFPHLA